MLLTYS